MLTCSLKPQTSVAIGAAGIGEALPCLRDELPIVALGFESQFQNAEGCRIARFAVGLRGPEGPNVLATRAGNEFANAALGIRGAFRILRGESFIVMVVTADDDLRAAFIKRLKERLYREIIAVSASGTEERLVPIGKGAGRGMLCKIRAQPFVLR